MENKKPKPHSALDETSETGAFVRVDSCFKQIISDSHEIFKPEANRYHLYVSYACPWAHRCLITRAILGLEDVISVSIVHPTWLPTNPTGEDDHCGWHFKNEDDPPVKNSKGYGSFDCKGCIPDTINNTKTIRELYEKSNDTLGKYSVPVLWDKKTGQIVNNESSDIIRMFSHNFSKLSKKPFNIYPENLKAEIDKINDLVYPNINNGVYRCGFAKTQEAYDGAVKDLFCALDQIEELLSKQRYLVGDQFTEAEIRAFVTLLRFDEVYVVYFKTDCKKIKDYPNILNYVREIYQMPGVKDTVNMKHIKTHYYTSHPTLNTYAIIPKGPNFLGLLEQPHNREQIGKQ